MPVSASASLVKAQLVALPACGLPSGRSHILGTSLLNCRRGAGSLGQLNRDHRQSAVRLSLMSSPLKWFGGDAAAMQPAFGLTESHQEGGPQSPGLHVRRVRFTVRRLPLTLPGGITEPQRFMADVAVLTANRLPARGAWIVSMITVIGDKSSTHPGTGTVPYAGWYRRSVRSAGSW